MRFRGLLILLILGGCVDVFGQMATLPGVSIQATFPREDAATIAVSFGERRLIVGRNSSENLNFGSSTGPAAALVNGQPLPAGGLRQGLDTPAWLLDSEGRGFYFPAQQDVQLVASDPTFSLQSLVPKSLVTGFWIEFGKISAKDLADNAALMRNPTLAPLQMTENDDDALIVYDTLTKTTAYVLLRSSEKMSSEGYLSGSAQSGLVLIRSNARKLVLSGAKMQPGTMRLKLFGDWIPAATETDVLKCEQKAGRTWVEFSAGPEGSAEIDLEELPDKGFLRRIIELFAK